MKDKEHAIVAQPTTLPTDRALHPMVEAALKLSPTVETIEKLMRMQEEWERNNAKRAFTTALVALKRDLPPIIGKDKKADMGQGRPKYSYSSLAHVMEAITPALTEHGFSVSAPASTAPDPKTGATIITVKATLTHSGGHSESTSLSGPVDNSGAKSQLQGIGASITYLQRYATVALLGLATGDMVEPEGGTPTTQSDQIDTDKNLQALNHFIRLGKKKGEVETFVGKPVADWTLGDIDRLRIWGKPATTTPPPAGPEEPEPHGDIKCPDCKYSTDDTESFEGHLQGTGHGQRATARR